MLPVEAPSDTSAASMGHEMQSPDLPAHKFSAAEGPGSGAVPETREKANFDRPANIELPSIGMVTGIKSSVAGNIPSINKAGPLQRPNIIQLPGNMIPPTKVPMGHQSMPSHAAGPLPSSAGRMLSPTFGPVPHAYGPVGMTTSQGYHASAPPPSSQPAPGSQKMELHDAFAYLDRVKAEFADQPDVYNRFLQIMREFKANA